MKCQIEVPKAVALYSYSLGLDFIMYPALKRNNNIILNRKNGILSTGWGI
jgi:hypothetical protein